LEDRRNVGGSSCNSGDGTDQRVQSLMFMMMMITFLVRISNYIRSDLFCKIFGPPKQMSFATVLSSFTSYETEGTQISRAKCVRCYETEGTQISRAKCVRCYETEGAQISRAKCVRCYETEGTQISRAKCVRCYETEGTQISRAKCV
jgi:hypothetical protein